MGEQIEGKETSQQRAGETPAQRRKRLAKAGYGNGPLLAGAIMGAGALTLVGLGFAYSAQSDDGVIASIQQRIGNVQTVSTDTSPDGQELSDGKVVVELPDKDRNGIPDVLERDESDGSDSSGGSGDQDTKDSSKGPAGKGDEGAATKPEAPQAQTYIIENGDTLAEISAETGVSVDALAEANSIRNPNLIFAGSALLIPAP